MKDVEYYCQSCGTYTEALSDIAALDICPACATGEDHDLGDIILFI